MASNHSHNPSSGPPSPLSRNRGSRASSASSINANQLHRPPVPSGLRQTHVPPSSPEDRRTYLAHAPDFETDGIHIGTQDQASPQAEEESTLAQAEINEPGPVANARSRLLASEHLYHIPHNCGDYQCDHGTFPRRPDYRGGYGSFSSVVGDDRSEDGLGGHAPEVSRGQRSYRGDFVGGWLGDAVTNGLLGKRDRGSTTHWLAERHGVRHERWMYLFYYLPITNWIPQYRWRYLKGDFIAALTMASFYIPISLSYASNLAHVPPINGLYSFVFNPLIYAILGTCPQMVVGPEAAGSLLTGSVVQEAIRAGTHKDHEGLKHAQVAGMVTGLAGGFILVAGLCRLGFLDGVLSRPFLRGFISAIGITILVGQLIPEMGLDAVAAHSSAASHGSSLDKILFLTRHGKEAHGLTCAVSFSTIAIVLILREIKRRLQPRMSWVAYVPERFIIVVLSAVIAWKADWEGKGLDVLGDIRSQGTPFKVHFPFDEHNFRHVNDAFSTAFIVALLGFFESSVAAKSLGVGTGKVKKTTNDKGETVEESEGIRGVTLSTNRELVALGVANLIGGLFMSIPAFGGYGRSKVNASTGGKTPMSSIFLSLLTLICTLFLLPYFYYIPKGTLSAMISVVAFSLIEEAPHDIRFFLSIGGYIELALMLLIFVTTFLWNLKIGIAVGIGLSLLRVLKHSTRPRIQILGRVPGTRDFENAELYTGGEGSEGIEMVPHCLIVKIPEPLTFANTGSLKDRLRRLEDHGTEAAHPALPKVRRPEHNQNLIFDVHGVTSLDPAAAQVLLEIVESYVERGVRVFFCRVPGRRTESWKPASADKRAEVWRLMQLSGIVDLCGGEDNFFRSVDEALQAAERATPQMYSDDEEQGPRGESASGRAGPAEPSPQPDHDPLTT